MKHKQQSFGIILVSFALLTACPVGSLAQAGQQKQIDPAQTKPIQDPEVLPLIRLHDLENQGVKDQTLIRAIQQGDDNAALAALNAGASGEAIGTYDPPDVFNGRVIDSIIFHSYAYHPFYTESPKVNGPLHKNILHMPALLMVLRYMDKNTALVRALLDHGARVDDRDGAGRTPLFYAITYSPEITRLLISRGAAINVSDTDGVTPLMQADVEETKILLEYGAKINAVDKLHQTALLRAADNRQIDKVRVLLEQGADVSVKDHYGSTALDYVTATDPVGEQIYALLKQHGAK